MREIILFGEDYGHEAVLVPLINRLADDRRVAVRVATRSCRHGHGRAITEMQTFLREVVAGLSPMPDLIVVAIDANCKGLNPQTADIRKAVPAALRNIVVCAIPAPHMERWLLLDPRAFKAVLGRGCQAPNAKCERDRYKRLLREAVSATGVTTLLGGLEYAEDLVKEFDLKRARHVDKAFDRAVGGLSSVLNRWVSE